MGTPTAMQEPRASWDQVLPSSVPAQVAVEHAFILGWNRSIGGDGVVMAMHTFGAAG